MKAKDQKTSKVRWRVNLSTVDLRNRSRCSADICSHPQCATNKR